MPTRQNPFSLYDFLGYFTPGALAIYLVVIFNTPAIIALEPLVTRLEEAITLQTPAYLILFVLVAYTLGHVLSFVSSLTVERYYLWMFDYPSKEMLKEASPSFFTLEKPLVQKLFAKSALMLLLFPVVALDLLSRKLLRLSPLFEKHLDMLLRILIERKMAHLIMVHGNASGAGAFTSFGQSDFFRYIYHYTVANCPNHLQKMQNYVALYGLLRTLCLLLILCFWATVISGHLTPSSYAMVAITAASSYLLFLNFAKFYRRFTLEAYMAMAVTYPESLSIEAERIARGVPAK